MSDDMSDDYEEDWADRVARECWMILRTEIALVFDTKKPTELDPAKEPSIRRRWAKAIRKGAREAYPRSGLPRRHGGGDP